jgi:hypothetical protein
MESFIALSREGDRSFDELFSRLRTGTRKRMREVQKWIDDWEKRR